ncbi:SMI1/KNR4 family protein [Treponema pedis]|nr:SMI1/KNR4 family protein [Treponema pedis]
MDVTNKDKKMNLFKDSKLLYEGRESQLSEEEIRQLLGINCDKINNFIQLYLIYDGIFFPKQAMMFRHTFYTITKGDWDKIEIGFFLKFDDIIKTRKLQIENNTGLDYFTQTHIPFADDGFGNDIWIEISTGVIKVFYHEYSIEEGLITVAPNFDDFCSSLENWTLK